MYMTITNEGSCECLYGGQTIEIADGVGIDEVQAFIDGWRHEEGNDMVDQFGSIKEDVTLDDIVGLLPEEWNARKTGIEVRVLFC